MLHISSAINGIAYKLAYSYCCLGIVYDPSFYSFYRLVFNIFIVIKS